MRIAYLSASAIPSRAANSVHVMKMCAAFARRGHEVTLFAWRGVGELSDIHRLYGVKAEFGIQLIKRPMVGALAVWKYAREVRRAARATASKRFDLVYARHRYVLVLASGLGQRLIFEAHAPPERMLDLLFESALLSKTRLARLVVISEALRSEYMRVFPDFSQNRICVAHDGADLPSPLARTDATRAVSSPGAPLVVGYVGHLYPGKGMEIIVALAPLLPEMRFVVIGGTEEDLAYWRSLATSENVSFRGHVPHGDVSEHLAAMDVVLAPYQRQVQVAGGKGDVARWMSPLKIFEYMAHGKTIVASDLPVLREVLMDGCNALLCPPDDVDAWRTALLKLSQNKILRTRLAQRGLADFLKHYRWDARAESVLEELEAGN